MGFVMFSSDHIGALICGAVILVVICLFRNWLRVADRKVRWPMAAALLLCELSLQGWYLIRGTWEANSLPLQLCSMTLLFSAAALLFLGRLQDIVFFLGTLGAIQALITPNLDYGFPHFRYFHFFAAHIGIMATAMYLYAVQGYRPRFRSCVRAFVWLQAMAIIAAAANALFGTNFMFLARKPSTASLLDALSPWPWYLLELEVVAAVLLLLLFGLTRTVELLTKRSKLNRKNKFERDQSRHVSNRS